MRRQFVSWTSGLGNHSRDFFSGPAFARPVLPLGRRNRAGMLRSSWLWTAATLIVLLVGSITLLSVFSPSTPATIPTAAAAGTAAATVVPPYDPNLGMAEEIPWGRLVLDMIVRLVIVIALIVGVVWLIRALRRRFGFLAAIPSSSGSFRVLDSSQLGAGHSIYTVDLGTRILVLGATAAGMSKLTELTNPVEIQELRRRSGVEPGEFDSLIAEVQAAGDGGPVRSVLPFQDVAQRLRNLAGEGGEVSPQPGSGGSSTPD